MNLSKKCWKCRLLSILPAYLQNCWQSSLPTSKNVSKPAYLPSKMAVVTAYIPPKMLAVLPAYLQRWWQSRQSCLPDITYLHSLSFLPSLWSENDKCTRGENLSFHFHSACSCICHSHSMHAIRKR